MINFFLSVVNCLLYLQVFTTPVFEVNSSESAGVAVILIALST